MVLNIFLIFYFYNFSIVKKYYKNVNVYEGFKNIELWFKFVKGVKKVVNVCDVCLI